MGRVAQTAAVIKDKDFDGAAWAARHDSSFRDLIASARRSRQETTKKMKTEEVDKGVEGASESSTRRYSEPVVISSSQPLEDGPTTADNVSDQHRERRSDAAPGLESTMPPSHAEPMAWELSQRPLASTPSAEGASARIVDADKY